jgi:hypothetical protein
LSTTYCPDASSTKNDAVVLARNNHRENGVMPVSSGTKYTSNLFLTCKAKDAAPIKCPNLVDFVKLAKPKPSSTLT